MRFVEALQQMIVVLIAVVELAQMEIALDHLIALELLLVFPVVIERM